MKKEQMLNHWKKIKPRQSIAVCEIPYKHKGSTYDCDGIRITGSAQFIDSVLSNIKDLLQHENGEQRLGVAYQQSKDKDTGALLDSFNCYIQVHERGHEAKMCNAIIEGARARQAQRQAVPA